MTTVPCLSLTSQQVAVQVRVYRTEALPHLITLWTTGKSYLEVNSLSGVRVVFIVSIVEKSGAVT